MGCVSSLFCGETPNVKKGELYSHMRSQLVPFDLVLFNGGDFVSDFISYMEKKNLKNPPKKSNLTPGEFSHVGMIVTSDILQHELVKPGKIYILESTLGGKLGSGVKNIEGHTFFGVQLRDFDELMPKYDKPNNTSIAVAHLRYNPWVYGSAESRASIRSRFTEVFDRVNGIPYNANPYSLLAAIFPCLRPEREVVEDLFGTKKWLFCSELVALIYKTFGIYPFYVNIENIVPMDLVQDSDIDNRAPIVIELPPIFITTEYHK